MGLVSPLAYCLAQRGFRVISYETRGEDDCFVLRRRFHLDDLVSDLDEFLDQMCLERPLVLGVSFGAAIAMTLAARRGRSLAGVASQGVNARFEKSLLRQVAGRVLSQYPLPPDSPFVNQFFNLLFGGRQRDQVVFDFVTSQCWQTDQSVMAYRFRLAEGMNLAPLLKEVRLPTLLMAGDRDLLAPPDGLDEMARRLPHAATKQLPGAGHLAFVTHAVLMADLVEQFARTEAGLA
jgi:3-oxoadipate enol-lactonase